jgi:predicted RNase H-like HicB family nuclease
VPSNIGEEKGVARPGPRGHGQASPLRWWVNAVARHSSPTLRPNAFDSTEWPVLQFGQRVVMLTEYIEAAMRKAKYEILSDDNTFYGYIPGFDGVYANAEDLETCRSELKEVLEEWIMLGISRHLPLPVVDGLRLVVEEAV